MGASKKPFLTGFAAGAAAMDFRNSFIWLIFSAGFFFLAVFVLFGSFFMPQFAQKLSRLEPQSAQELEDASGLVALTGIPTASDVLRTPVQSQPALYYHYVESEYRVVPVEKTRTVREENREFTEPYTDYEAQWVVVRDETKWTPFSIDGIEIQPELAQVMLDSAHAQVLNEEETVKTFTSDIVLSEQVGVAQKIRRELSVISPDQPLVVVGLLDHGQIRSAKDGLFMITDKSFGQLLEDQISYEREMRAAAWMGFQFFVVLALFCALMPVIRFLNILPGLGTLVAIPLFGVIAILVYGLGFLLRSIL